MLGQIIEYLSNLSGGQSDEPVKENKQRGGLRAALDRYGSRTPTALDCFLRKGKALKSKIKEKYPLWGKALRKD